MHWDLLPAPHMELLACSACAGHFASSCCACCQLAARLQPVTSASPQPTLRMKKDTLRPALEACAASARATRVLPVPGGP
jgi:hypothetical protein